MIKWEPKKDGYIRGKSSFNLYYLKYDVKTDELISIYIIKNGSTKKYWPYELNVKTIKEARDELELLELIDKE